MLEWFRGSEKGGEERILSVRSDVLADPCPEPLSGASNVGGIAASTSEFIDYTRHQLSGQAVLEPKERTDGVRIGKGRKKIDLRVEGAKGRDEGFDVFRRVVVIERSREVEGQLRNRGSFGDIRVHSIKESCRELFKELEKLLERKFISE